MEILLKPLRLQMPIPKPKTILGDDLARESTESINKIHHRASISSFLEALAQQLDLVSYNRFEFRNTTFREHGVQRCASNCVEIAFCGCERHVVRSEAAGHPFVSVVSSGAGVEFFVVVAIFDVELEWSDADDWALKGLVLVMF
jgi:hypothetical protein